MYFVCEVDKLSRNTCSTLFCFVFAFECGENVELLKFVNVGDKNKDRENVYQTVLSDIKIRFWGAFLLVFVFLRIDFGLNLPNENEIPKLIL